MKDQEIDALIETIKSSKTSWRSLSLLSAVRRLGIIGTVNPKAIAALIQLLDTTKDNYIKDNYIRRRVAEILGKIDPGNPKVLAALIQLNVEIHLVRLSQWKKI